MVIGTAGSDVTGARTALGARGAGHCGRAVTCSPAGPRMADDRQHKLAAARRKLKEYQQKTTPPAPAGGKKKKKGKESNSHPDTPNRLSPDPIEAILKGLVSDLHRSNGVSIPALGDMKVLLEQDVVHDAEILTEDVSDNSKTPTEMSYDNPLSEQNDCDDMKLPTDGNRFVSSTDSLRQLSEQLNGLVSQTNSYVNGENLISSSSPEVESRFQDLAAALDSSNLTNKQLGTKIEELKQQNQDVMGKLDKERKEFEQKFSKEQGSLREQLQVHIQTIGILVSEKSELQTALSYTQQAARQKGAEVEDLVMRLQSTRQRVTELERTLSSISAQQKQLEKLNKEMEKDRDNLRLESLRNSKSSDDLKLQNSELSEKLNVLLSENATMRLELGDLHKKLEMAELMIQQFSNQTGTPDANQQLRMALEERDQLGTQLTQMSDSLQHLTAERDQYVEKLKDEGAIWQERVRQLSQQIQTLIQEKESACAQVEQLETRLTELLLASAEPAESEPSVPQGPSEAELALQQEVEKLQQEFHELQSRYHAQVQDNSQLSRLNQEQEERLQELESTLQRQSEDSVDKQQILENMQSDKATISRALTQNRQLKEQLAEFQNGFVKLTNENLELTNGLQSELHVKKELAKRLGQLQESLGDFKEQLAMKAQELQLLQTQRDEISAHLQQYAAAYQQVSIEKEEIQRQYLLQAQLMDRLQHDEVQGKVSAEIHLKELQQSRENLELLTKENRELRAQVLQICSEPDSRALSRMEGDGVESIVYEDEIPKSSLVIPQDFESREEMMAFLSSALSKLHGERDEVERQLTEQKRNCKQLLQQISELRLQQMSSPHHHSAEISVDSVPREVYEALQSAMEKLQFRFTDLMQERVELKERVEELEHRCIQLSGETDTIGEYIALYQSQRAILKQRHTEKEEYISRLAQDKEEMKAKLLELQVLVMRLVSERNEWYKKYLEATRSSKELGELALSAERPVDMDTATGEALEEVSLEDGEEDKAQGPSHVPSAHEVASMAPSSQDATAKQIIQLLRDIQNPQERPGFLIHNPCIPFFYRVDENDEVRIMVV
ncbi:golgin subfamily A member 2 isoform X3 [Pseudophryne corroboree]|uniref:golgin subfamily A member 2 isoform X3 n=1 Tax=Pseudophryne corroboree TaxID=495146 RepID=UPI003081EB5A